MTDLSGSRSIVIITFDPWCHFDVVHWKLLSAVVSIIISISGSATEWRHRLWETTSDSYDFYDSTFDPQIWVPKRPPAEKSKSQEAEISYMHRLNPSNADMTLNKRLCWIQTYVDLRDPFNSFVYACSDLGNSGVRGQTREVIKSDPTNHHSATSPSSNLITPQQMWRSVGKMIPYLTLGLCRALKSISKMFGLEPHRISIRRRYRRFLPHSGYVIILNSN